MPMGDDMLAKCKHVDLSRSACTFTEKEDLKEKKLLVWISWRAKQKRGTDVIGA